MSIRQRVDTNDVLATCPAFPSHARATLSFMLDSCESSLTSSASITQSGLFTVVNLVVNVTLHLSKTFI